MKRLALALLASGVPAAASAQFLYIGDTFYQSLSRPYRDRAERFKSSRTDALQMTVAVDDEASGFTLENWGDNRADLRSAGRSAKVSADLVAGDVYTTGGARASEWRGGGLGAHARYGRMELEGYAANWDKEPAAGGAGTERNFMGGGAGFAFGEEDLSMGLHANFNRTGDKDWDEVNYNHAFGGALALRTRLWEAGVTADYVQRGSEDGSAGEELPLNGLSLGAQAMLKPLKGLKAAVRGNVARLSGDATDNGVAYDNYEMSYAEGGVRLEWKLEALPLTFGLDYARMVRTPDEALGGARTKSELDNSLKTAGAALRLLGDRLLLGVEVKEFDYSNSNILPTPSETEGTYRTLTGGAEFLLLPGLAARASVQKLKAESASAETFSTIFGGGIGFSGEKLSLDLAARRINEDEDAVEPDAFTDVRVQLGLKF